VLLEQARRRPGFDPGIAIELADGRTWWFPGPDPRPADPDYGALIRSVVEAEDMSESCLAELALAIMLLTQNYDLMASELQSLLTFAPRDRARMHAAFSDLAATHVQAMRPVESPSVSPASSSGWFQRIGRKHKLQAREINHSPIVV